jgi:DNA polymerase-1
MSRLFLVDGYALIYRAFFAMLSRPLTTSRGENTSVAWGITNFLLRTADKHHPDFIAWVNDAGTSFRHEALPEYKATRQKLDAELQQDFDQSVARVEQLLTAFRVPLVAVDGYEADDVIATLAVRAATQGIDTVIVSGDKDFYQLIGPHISLLNPGRGGPAAVEEHFVTEANATERFGVPPDRIVDYLALVGDASDNVPGVTGIGEKTATKLITEFGDLETILARAAEVTGKRPRESLLAQGDQARLSRRLVTLHRDVPVPVDIVALRAQPPDIPALLPMLRELEFNSLVRSLSERVAASGTVASASAPAPAPPSAEPPPQPPRAARPEGVRYDVADTVAAVLDAVQAARSAGVVGLAVRGTQAEAMRAGLVGLALAVGDGRAWYLPFGHEVPVEFFAPQTRGNLPPLSDPALSPLVQLFSDPEVAKVGHDVKYALLMLRRAGTPLRGIAFDTMIASFMVDPGRRTHALDAVAAEHFGVELHTLEAPGKGAPSPAEVAVRVAADALCADADLTLRLRERLEPLLAEHALASLYQRTEMPLIGVLADMEWEGVAIDRALFERLTGEFRAELAGLVERIHHAAGTEFNIASTQQLRHVLFEKLQLPVIKKTKTGPSTDADVLDELAALGHEVPKLLLEYREVSKLLSTYLESLPQAVNPRTGRIHTSFNQIGAATGRISSTEPNLQNIPVRSPRGEAIRRGFVPKAGSQFVVADYSQIELRLLAHLSNDAAFVAAFRKGGDIHRQTAAVIFGVDVDTVTADQRARAKTINFATIYGQGPHSLSRQLGISRDEAKQFIEAYFIRFAGVRQFLDGCVELAKTKGYAETIFGRRRYIPELKDKNFNMRAFGERTATNSPLQGSAADLIKIAMVRVRDALAAGYQARLLLQVHDELLVEAPAAEARDVADLVKKHMEGAAQLSVPLVADVGIGGNWLDAKSDG